MTQARPRGGGRVERPRWPRGRVQRRRPREAMAIDVPLGTGGVVVATGVWTEVILSPGGEEVEAATVVRGRSSRVVGCFVAPTVIASATRAGEASHASEACCPPETAYVTPLAIDFFTASSSANDTEPPRLMFATAGL